MRKLLIPLCACLTLVACDNQKSDKPVVKIGVPLPLSGNMQSVAASSRQAVQTAIKDANAVGMQSAEVTMGGISTDKISSKTMESKICRGLYFTGEAMDITGDLGGYNLQWAFSSGFVAGLNA